MSESSFVSKYLPEAMYELGFTDLISVTPPNAQLAPSSKLVQSQLGKAPGVRSKRSGLWSGYDWRKAQHALDDVRQWAQDGANVGLRAARFPGVDIDCTDERLVNIITDLAQIKLGLAPKRTGKPPKQLLMYRTDEPFGRMRLWIKQGDQHHLVEVLGDGQQYLIHGIHPSTNRPYVWDAHPSTIGVQGLTPITRELANQFLEVLKKDMEDLGFFCEREGDGRPPAALAADQTSLLAPSMEALSQAVEMIPNHNEQFAGRNDYLQMGYAIRAAAGPENESEAFDIFAEWASRWEGNDRHAGNDAETVRADWRRMKGPYKVGWPWIAELARGHGYNDAANDFDVIAPTASEKEPAAVRLSDQWLADTIIARRGRDLRYSPERGLWYAWDGHRWVPDAVLMADEIINRELVRIADMVVRQASTEKEKAQALKEARSICSADRASSVRTKMRASRAIAVSVAALDHDPWILNTPGGVVDLRTGDLHQPDPDLLCTRTTKVAPDFGGPCPEWRRFLMEATGGDEELQLYLQRLAGYCLTGVTREQQFTFIHGPGGNGKSVFMGVLQGILGDYVQVASMETFTASAIEKHSTDVAMLAGARLVTASETQQGKRWDTQKVKSMTGGEPITARFMRQDNFTFLPQFKLVFTGNHKPEIRDLDEAMKRRTHLVPFVVKPVVVDKELSAKLRQEYPAILAWMIDGALMWLYNGLVPPPVVRVATEEYFAENDPIGRWLEERTDLPVDGEGTLTLELYSDFREWANANGEWPRTARILASALVARKVPQWRHAESRRRGFALKLKATELVGINA